jgi:hypothetical protein
MSTDLHFPIRMDAWVRPLLLVGGATRENAWLELDEEDLAIHFGFLFGHTIPRSEIESAARREWPVWMGLGWRGGPILGQLVGLIGSLEGVVEIRLRNPIPVWGLLRCTRVAVSLEQPDEFLAALAVPQNKTDGQ